MAERHGISGVFKAAASPYINHPLELARTLTQVGGVVIAPFCSPPGSPIRLRTRKRATTSCPKGSASELPTLLAQVTEDKRLSRLERKRLRSGGKAGVYHLSQSQTHLR
jgi:hypothetical protein